MADQHGSTGFGSQTRQTDEYGNPIPQTGGALGGQTRQTDEYGNPIPHTGGALGGQTRQTDEYGNPIQHTAGGGVFGHGKKEHAGQGGGILHRSNSSSSSSSEDDGQGGRRKKSIKDKIKEKLPGGNKQQQGAYGQGQGLGGATTTTGHQEGYGGHSHGVGGATTTQGAYGQEQEKKGFMEKIKEKLPGGGNH